MGDMDEAAKHLEDEAERSEKRAVQRQRQLEEMQMEIGLLQEQAKAYRMSASRLRSRTGNLPGIQDLVIEEIRRVLLIHGPMHHRLLRDAVMESGNVPDIDPERFRVLLYSNRDIFHVSRGEVSLIHGVAGKEGDSGIEGKREDRHLFPPA